MSRDNALTTAPVGQTLDIDAVQFSPTRFLTAPEIGIPSMSSTPLTNKRPITITLNDDDEKEDIPSATEYIKRAARRCNDMIWNVFSFVRI